MKIFRSDNSSIGVLAIIFVAIAVICSALCATYIYVQADRKEMQQQNCTQTGIQRQSFYMQFTYDAKGNITSSFPVFYMEFEYKCDDYNRWR